MENINTLKSIKEKDKKKNNDDNQQAFYAGGSRHSGQQILGPPKATDEIIKDLFKSALEAGAQPTENEDGVIDDKPSESFPDNLKPESSSSSKKPTVRKLKLWRNGFSIDDGKLRSYDEPENLEFIASVKKGEIPQELINETRGKETIDISISDYRPVSPNSEKANEENAIKTLDTDLSKPTTKIQVRLADGTK
ncbi:hypothetical protein RND71_043756 [Anisodus tanguticus]|uniref:SEP domain-containing protein n=1 Tax=Anisodus tanguticus TaxID=243964 RepID=A0AAE1UTQ2_9SOLA|nr:hypothetical protein RND71_043756 [Anisodus tanguticus]